MNRCSQQINHTWKTHTHKTHKREGKSDLGKEISQEGYMTEAVSCTASIEFVAFDYQLERI